MFFLALPKKPQAAPRRYHNSFSDKALIVFWIFRCRAICAIGRSGFAAGWRERSGWVVRTGEGPDIETFWCDTFGFPAVVAGVPWPPHTKGYHDVRTQKSHDPGHAARRAGPRDPTRVSAGCSPTGRLLHGFARSPQRAER